MVIISIRSQTVFFLFLQCAFVLRLQYYHLARCGDFNADADEAKRFAACPHICTIYNRRRVSGHTMYVIVDSIYVHTEAYTGGDKSLLCISSSQVSARDY